MPSKAVSKNTQAEAQTTEAKKNPLLEARNAATRRLIEENKERHDALYIEEAAARGVTYTPELTPAQKREQQLRALLEEDPSLREKILAEQNVVDEG